VIVIQLGPHKEDIIIELIVVVINVILNQSINHHRHHHRHNCKASTIDREFEFYEFFSFVKSNEFYEFFFG